jgi:hypothetical protein
MPFHGPQQASQNREHVIICGGTYPRKLQAFLRKIGLRQGCGVQYCEQYFIGRQRGYDDEEPGDGKKATKP